MATNPIDYAALAKQNGAVSSTSGGGVDYAAMAKQAGATGYAPPATADHSVRDHLKDEGFLDSAWNVIKSPFSLISSIVSGEDAKSHTADMQRAKELEKSGTPEQRREFAKEYLLKTIPGASTVYKASQGNYAGAAGDVAGMAALGGIAKGAAKATDAAGTIKQVVTNPEVARAALDVVPKGAAVGRLIDKVQKVRGAASASAPVEQPAGGHAFSDAPPVEAAPVVAEAATPGQALAKASGQDWAKMSGEDRAMLESVAKAQANAAAQPPRPPMGPPVAPVEAPAPTGPRMTAADELRAEMEAQRAAAPPVTETPQPALGGHDTTPAVSRGAPVRPPLRRPLPTETRAQYEAAINAPVSTAPVEATPVTQPPPAPGPVEVPMSTAQAEAAMANKAPAPVEEPQSQYTASGERKSPQLRAAEITGKNVTAKAQRWAEALQAEGITAEDVGNMTPADLEVMNNGLQAKGALPKGEKAPGQSLPEIVARLRKLGSESKQASAAISPESEVGTRLTPKQRAIAEQMKAAMEDTSTSSASVEPKPYQPNLVTHGMQRYDSNLYEMVQNGDAAGFGGGSVKVYSPELRSDTTSAATRATYDQLLDARKKRLFPETIKGLQKKFDSLLEADRQAFAKGGK